MKGHIGKMPGMVVRVATVLALLDWAHTQVKPEVMEVDASYIIRACHYVGEHLRGHAYRAYGISSVSPDHKLARRLAHIILTEHLTELNIRQVQQRELAGKPDAKALKAACAVFVEADWLALMPSQGAGRPKGSYAVNPKFGAGP